VLRAPVSVDERRLLVLDADAVLGLDLHRVWEQARPVELPGDVERLLSERSQARAARDYARADTLRTELEGRGYAVVDRADGTAIVSPARPGRSPDGR
jgi:cysteinyl-tRNA synthetase